jgi:hypothetical protein
MLLPQKINSELVPLHALDQVRKSFNGSTSRAARSEIGQFLTPTVTARFMSSLFEDGPPHARILDPGAGVLFAMCVEALVSRKNRPVSITVEAYETDDGILPHLVEETMKRCRSLCRAEGVEFNGFVKNEDFVPAALAKTEESLFTSPGERFTHAILNPPCMKINSRTAMSRQLYFAHIEVANLYAAFVWLAMLLLEQGGQMAAITPRSFCNGPYFKKFRTAFIESMSLKQIHIFGSRRKAFGDDNVLQENIIYHAVRGLPKPKSVTISTSEGLNFNEARSLSVPCSRVVQPGDGDMFIHLDIDDSGSGPAETRISEALSILGDLGFPRQQQNERSALTLLSLVGLEPAGRWEDATDPLMWITPMMEFFAKHYGKKYAPNTRETVRRQTVHQFLQAALIVANPDKPSRPTNSPKAVYRIEPSVLKLLRSFGKPGWKRNLQKYLRTVDTLKILYAREREMRRLPVRLATGQEIRLSPGGQNVLVKKIIDDFCPLFTPGGRIIYVGDTQEKWAYFDAAALTSLGVEIPEHGKMPDIAVHYTDKNWLVLIEAVTSHGPVNPKRRLELKALFSGSTAGLVFVTAFLGRREMLKYLHDISWETEVWIAESPTHLIHFNGERFLGPYEV